jgi:Na+-transporting methylmalonyl-CoA/oxaloacetate decarboxylase gamma subunit
MEIVFIVLIIIAIVAFVWISGKANRNQDPNKAKTPKPKDL